ncbi:MAG: CdaR family protein [Acidobacteriota bacterium]
MLEILRRNVGLKLFALLIAFLIWANVAGRGQQIRNLVIPLDVTPPVDMLVIAFEPQEVRVRLRGFESQMERLVPERLYARIDLGQIDTPGEHRLAVTPQDVFNVPRGVVVEEILTDEVVVKLERRLEKTVRVQAETSGEPAEGFEVASVTVEPLVVTLRGPESVVASLETVRTRPVDIAGRSEDVVATVKVVPPARARLVEFPQGDEVKVSVRIVERPTEASWEEDVVVPPEVQVDLRPARVAVTVKAPPSRLAEIRDALVVRLPADAVSSRPKNVPVQVDLEALDPELRERVEIVAVEPAKVRVAPRR